MLCVLAFQLSVNEEIESMCASIELKQWGGICGRRLPKDC